MPFQTQCPNCYSSKFIETVSLEYCPDCGLECDYHGGKGANSVYQNMMDRKWAAEEARTELEPEWWCRDDEF